MPFVYDQHIKYWRKLLQRVALEEGLPPTEPWEDGAGGNHRAVLSWDHPTLPERYVQVEINIGIGYEAVQAYWVLPITMVYHVPLKNGWIPKGNSLEGLCREACRAVKAELEKTCANT